MKNRILLLALFCFGCVFNFAQTITFISETSGEPLPKVMVFSNDGTLITTSDIAGNIQKENLNPALNEYNLVYENFSIGKLKSSDLNQSVIKLRERIIDVEPVVVSNRSKVKYILLKGNFNSYIFVNDKLNTYADGIVTYIFDSKTKKLKNQKVEQYRIFELKSPDDDSKVTSGWNYNFFLDIADMKSLVNINDFRNDEKTLLKEVSASGKDVVEVRQKRLQEKELSLFGYRIFDVNIAFDFAFEKDSKKTYRDLLEYSENRKIKLKHKSEPNFNQVVIHRNFYPVEIEYSDSDKINDVKFRKNYSSYRSKYWLQSGFPNLQEVFQNFFKNDLKEVEMK